MVETLRVDDLDFEVRRSARRQTVQITVDRGGELVLSAPDQCPVETMEEFVREKQGWIYTKLAEKERTSSHPPPARAYTNGEGFPYLGRSHRLLLVDKQDVPVKLDGGRFKMRRDASSEGRQHMVRWYTSRAQKWLQERVSRWQGRVDVDPAGVLAQDLGYRWGSCGKGGKLYFHWRTILLPPHIIEYVVVHELVHLHEPHHTPEFWTRLERALPDYAQRKLWLAENAAGVPGP